VLRRIDSKAKFFRPKRWLTAARISFATLLRIIMRNLRKIFSSRISKSQSARRSGKSAARTASGGAGRSLIVTMRFANLQSLRMNPNGPAHRVNAAVHPYVQSPRGARRHGPDSCNLTTTFSNPSSPKKLVSFFSKSSPKASNSCRAKRSLQK